MNEQVMKYVLARVKYRCASWRCAMEMKLDVANKSGLQHYLLDVGKPHGVCLSPNSYLLANTSRRRACLAQPSDVQKGDRVGSPSGLLAIR